MEKIVKLATQKGYDRFHPQWFENNKLEPKTELLEMVLLQKWIREEHHIDIIVTSKAIGYGYLLYKRYPPKNITSKFISQTYEESLKEGIKCALENITLVDSSNEVVEKIKNLLVLSDIIVMLPTNEEIEVAATQNAKDYWGHKDEDMERGFENGVEWLTNKLKSVIR